MTKRYYRPIAQTDPALGGSPLAGGPVRFSQVEVLTRDGTEGVAEIGDCPARMRDRLSQPRAPICGLDWSRPRLMGVLNVTPDSFSDGGRFDSLGPAVDRAIGMASEGADMIDIGGESTRPGADFVSAAEEIDRTVPVIEAVRHALPQVPISIDTRKPEVAQAAIVAGADLFNDVSALTFSPGSISSAASLGVPVCLMHASGDPATMQDNPFYDNVALDIFDFLEKRLIECEAFGIPRSSIMVDPGIGFGKTLEHNLEVIRALSLFHGLGAVLLLGVSRKRFIGTIGQVEQADARAPGSIAVGLEGLRQGVQMLRVHDIAQTKQAIRLWQAVTTEARR